MYAPSDDTFLLIEAIRRKRGRLALEIGVGKGLVSSELAMGYDWAVATDIAFHAVKTASTELKSKGESSTHDMVCCDAASAFRNNSFDLVCFNPPYLPSEEKDDLAVDGGKGGIEIAWCIFQDASRVLRRGGSIVFIASSLSDYSTLVVRAEAEGFTVRTVARKRFFFEELLALEARRD